MSGTATCTVCADAALVIHNGETLCRDHAPPCPDPECESFNTYWTVDGRGHGVLECATCDSGWIT